MAYTKQTWVDRETEFPNRRKLVEVSQGVYDITRQQGTVTAEGTPITAARLNHMEDGIYAKQDAITSSNKLPYAYLSDVPTVLPNPQPLTFGNKSYDGSSAQVLVPSDIGLGTVFNLKGSKTTVSDLPSSGNVIGDVWYVIAEHVGYVWLNDGTERWEQLGLPVDLSGYAEIDGTYPDMAVGYAEHAEEADSAAYADQLDSTVALTVSTPFLFRPAAGGADVEGYLDSRAEIGVIYGNTVVSDGQLVHFTGTGIRSVGFNQWDEQIVPNQMLTTQGAAGERSGYYRSKNYIPVIGGMRYHFCVKPTQTVGQKTIAIWTYDSDKVPLRSYDGSTVTNKDVLFDANVAYIRFYSNQGVDDPRYENNITINLKWSGYRDGEYEQYHTETKALPVGTYFPDGMKSAGTVRDELTQDKAIRRCGVRAYQSGDETNPSVTTDGTNTVYALTEPVETVIDPPLDFSFRSSDYGTEMLLPETGTAPMTADISYVQNLRDKLQRMPMSPSAPGDYIVHFNGVNQSYVSVHDDLATLAAIADRTYDGVDIAAKFREEYRYTYNDNPWNWIKARITAEYFKGVYVHDWIPFTADGHTYKEQIAGINTYKNYGDVPVGSHIDFISKELWHELHPINPVNFNNGTKFGDDPAIECPWIACDHYLWLNSKVGTVASEAVAGGGTGTAVDYTSTGVYDKLPTELKAVIIEKRMLLGKRYSATGVLSNPNSRSWENAGKLWLPTEREVYGHGVFANAAYDMGGSPVQYPIFSGNMNCVKNLNNIRYNWWLLVPYSGSTTDWCCVSSNGYVSNPSTSSGYVSAPVCFRIG